MFANRRLERKVDALHAKLDLIMAHLGIEAPAPVAPVPAVPSVPRGDGLAEIDALIMQGKKIQAIKRYRELTGCGLKEAKDAVERRSPY
ncbi:ribosomal protein L7/L12 [Nocardia barduliensis]|uniref:ribosomal protein L7/L12 n=1 Tax=Nocardia barduliensis TaxID=2736643 RepID=UPI0015723D2C|nr:ribosomal protein L7/L12 [Nocardia barduliensis]